MADTALYTFSLQAVWVAPNNGDGTFGTQFQFDSIKSLSYSKKYVSDRAQGNSRITALAAQAISYDISLDTAGFQDNVLGVMQGLAAASSGVGINWDESNDLMPYFGLIGQTFPDTGDVLLFFPRCKITSDISYKNEFGKIVVPQIKIEGIKDQPLGYILRRRRRTSSSGPVTFPLSNN